MAAGGNTQVRRAYKSCNVNIALIKGVTIAFCCRAGKIPDNHICFLTSLEPDKVYSRSIGNNKGVAITIFFPARNIPISLDFLLLVLLVLRAALPSPTATPVMYYYDPPPSISPDCKTISWGGWVIIVMVTLIGVRA